MNQTTTYVTEHRHTFTGGYCTAYLTRGAAGTHFIHTITRMDQGTYIKTDPFEVGDGDHTAMLKRTAEMIPLT
jgi:hypothetical protein